MIYRNKRLDDNGPMGASLITLNQRHPDEASNNMLKQQIIILWFRNPAWPMEP